MPSVRSERAQASVELVALLPFLGLVCAAGWQLVLAGHAWWSAGAAARAGARAAAVGAPPREAAVAALPRALARAARVTTARGGVVVVRVRVPRVVGDLGTLTARAAFEGQR